MITLLVSESGEAGSTFWVKPFQWEDWNALWQLRNCQLAEDGKLLTDSRGEIRMPLSL
jgi:hypothetical protein